MQPIHSRQTQSPSNEGILARRSLGSERRPTRSDMLLFYSGQFVKPSTDTVCKGNCIYCDSDDDGGSDGVDISAR
jgi:wyosine [tRNA(Phe)-imidazoG37] synthetase (radical SAM superfamily)